MKGVMRHEARQVPSWLIFDVRQNMRRLIALLSLTAACSTGCGSLTDAATRIAYDIESGAKRLGENEGSSFAIQHVTPSRPGECIGPYKVHFDKVGLVVIWCKDSTGQDISRHSTSYHRRFVDTAMNYTVVKPAGAILQIHLERRNGRAIIAKVD